MSALSRLDERFRSWRIEGQRAKLISAVLPEAIDILVLVMRAGLDFQVALAYYLKYSPQGPLQEELSKVQAEIGTGMARIDALKNLRSRVLHRDLQETARAIIQGIELGSSLTPILRAQATALRKRRAFDAEKRAAVAPLKLMFPLFVFIFPTLFVILFGPVLLTVYA